MRKIQSKASHHRIATTSKTQNKVPMACEGLAKSEESQEDYVKIMMCNMARAAPATVGKNHAAWVSWVTSASYKENC